MPPKPLVIPIMPSILPRLSLLANKPARIATNESVMPKEKKTTTVAQVSCQTLFTVPISHSEGINMSPETMSSGFLRCNISANQPADVVPAAMARKEKAK